jgi:transcriptional regulator with XRE-family HTH domain
MKIMPLISRSKSISPKIDRSLQKFGGDIEIARKKRHLTIASLCDRAGISLPLYDRLVAGNPGTSIGAYASVMFALGLGTPFETLADAAKDDTGLLLEEARLPQRIRNPRKQTGAL